jgi:hypothetical protein
MSSGAAKVSGISSVCSCSVQGITSDARPAPTATAR